MATASQRSAMHAAWSCSRLRCPSRQRRRSSTRWPTSWSAGQLTPMARWARCSRSWDSGAAPGSRTCSGSSQMSGGSRLRRRYPAGHRLALTRGWGARRRDCSRTPGARVHQGRGAPGAADQGPAPRARQETPPGPRRRGRAQGCGADREDGGREQRGRYPARAGAVTYLSAGTLAMSLKVFAAEVTTVRSRIPVTVSPAVSTPVTLI